MWVETIDDLVADGGTAPTLMKLDIEGGESQALEGARRTLAAHRPIIVSEVAGDGAGAVIETLRRSEYRLWDLESGRPVGDGALPFMVVALPGEASDSTRGRRVWAALHGDGRRATP